VLYRDLRKLTLVRPRRYETITLLDTDSLVHRSCLRSLNSRELDVDNRGKFFAASIVMHSIVVDAVRKRRAECRRGAAEHVEFDTCSAATLAQDDEEIVRVNEDPGRALGARPAPGAGGADALLRRPERRSQRRNCSGPHAANGATRLGPGPHPALFSALQ
jgi:hypothetical protein